MSDNFSHLKTIHQPVTGFLVTDQRLRKQYEFCKTFGKLQLESRMMMMMHGTYAGIIV